MRKSVAGHATKTIFKIMNYFALQGKCSKDAVATFIVHLNVTIKHLTRNKQNKAILAANTNHASLLKNQSTIKYLP